MENLSNNTGDTYYYEEEVVSELIKSFNIELSKKYNLYRQNYCGCLFSKNESLKET